MNRYERVENVQGHIHCFSVAQVPSPRHVGLKRLAIDVFRDQEPIAPIGLSRPEDLNHVRMVDLAQRPDLPANRLVAGCAIKELERTLLVFHLVEDMEDLRKPTLTQDIEDLETVIDQVAHGVVG